MVAGNVRRITDNMMMAAAIALSKRSPSMLCNTAALLPTLSTIREVSQDIAKAFILQAIEEGHANTMTDAEIDLALHDTMWIPEYQPFTV